jgi:hypothetical protein
MDWNGFFACMMSAVFVVGIFGTVILLRWFRHREIVTLAEKGLLPAQYAQYLRASRGRSTLGWGIALSMLGLALMIGLWPLGFNEGMSYPLGFGPWMLGGLIPLFIGLALLITYFVTRKENGAPPEEKKVETPNN